MTCEPILAAAARNNAEWCATVWRSHGLAVERAQGLWFTRPPPPPFYPNAVAVDPGADPARQVALLVSLSERCPTLGVKDSFARLPLERFGFDELFEARWLWRDAADHPAASTQCWKRVESAGQLNEWEAAWRGGGEPTPAIHGIALLQDPHVVILARIGAAGAIEGGGIGYQTGDILGLTNMFGCEDGFVPAALRHSSAARLVRYERGEAARAAVRAGYADAGPLRVWARQA